MGNIKWISSAVFISMGFCQYLSTGNQTVFMCICLLLLGILFCYLYRRVSSALVHFWIAIVMLGLIGGILFNQGIIGADVGEYIICGFLSLIFLMFAALSWPQNRKIAYGEFLCALIWIILLIILKL